MAIKLSLVAGGGTDAPFDREESCAPAQAGVQTSEADSSGRVGEALRASLPWVPENSPPTLAELFASSPRDGGWAGFLLAQLDPGQPLLWVQERMAILEGGRLYPPGMQFADLIHVEARDAKAALWAMEEGLRCGAIGAVIGEIWGDPAALDFTATRRLAVAAERHGVAAWLVRLGGSANLSGARRRWRVASSASLIHPLNPRAPGAAVWDTELFRARGAVPGRWTVTHEAGDLHLVAAPADRALDEAGFRHAG